MNNISSIKGRSACAFKRKMNTLTADQRMEVVMAQAGNEGLQVNSPSKSYNAERFLNRRYIASETR